MIRVLLGTMLAATLCAPVAEAAPRKVCRLLGESESATVDAPNAALKIMSADVASNRTHVTAVIRMQTLNDPQAAATGRVFGFFFSPSVEENYVLQGTLWGTTPDDFWLGDVNSPFYPRPNAAEVKRTRWFTKVRVVVDAARNEVRMTAPLAAFRLRPEGTSLRPGTRVTYLAADVARMYGVPRDTAPFPDGAPSEVGTGGRWTYGGPDVTYTLGTPSCVAVGR